MGRAPSTLVDEDDERDIEGEFEDLQDEQEMRDHLLKTSRDPVAEARSIERQQEVRRAELKGDELKALMNSTLTPFVPTPLQVRMAEEIILSQKVPSYTAIGKKIGVSPKTIYGWFQEPGFRIWMDEMRMLMFFHVKPQMDKKLIRMGLKGSYKHMELFYTLNGDLKKEEKTEIFKGVQVDSMTAHEQYVMFQRTVSSLTGNMKQQNVQTKVSSNQSPAETDRPEDPTNGAEVS